MQYDPIKRSLGKLFNQSPWSRKLFYRLLDVLLLRTWHIRQEINKWQKNRKGPLKVLDAGSGFGQYTFFLSKWSKMQITAVDVKKEQIDDCSAFFKSINRNNVSFEVADLTNFRQTAKYDLVLSVDVMEHIEEDDLVFKNLFNALKKGGLLLISTPSDQGGSDVHDHDHESFIDEHVRDGYNINQIQDQLKRIGFSKTKAKYSYGNPGKAAWKISMKIPISMLNISKLFFVILPFYYLIVFPFMLLLNYADVKKTHSSGTGLIVKAYK